MAKLYFRYGAMASAKTLNLLAVAHNYRRQGKEVLLLKPELDVRFGSKNIKSRAGLEMTADVIINDSTDLKQLNLTGIDCILVDEAQFVQEKHIEQLREITIDYNIPIICYGLRTDFKSNLFVGAKRLMELADSIEEVKATCYFCNRKSVMNLRHQNGVAVFDGESIQLGADDKYFPTCYACYLAEKRKAQKLDDKVKQEEVVF